MSLTLFAVMFVTLKAKSFLYFSVTHPCNHNPCKRNQVCEINRSCLGTILDRCQSHTCVPGSCLSLLFFFTGEAEEGYSGAIMNSLISSSFDRLQARENRELKQPRWQEWKTNVWQAFFLFLYILQLFSSYQRREMPRLIPKWLFHFQQCILFYSR